MWIRVVLCMHICERFHPVLSYKFVCEPCANPKDINLTSVFRPMGPLCLHTRIMCTRVIKCAKRVRVPGGVVIMISEHSINPPNEPQPKPVLLCEQGCERLVIALVNNAHNKLWVWVGAIGHNKCISATHHECVFAPCKTLTVTLTLTLPLFLTRTLIIPVTD